MISVSDYNLWLINGEQMKKKDHILVTGGAGMIGSNLVKRLVKLGYRISVIDNLWRGKKEYLYIDDDKPIINMESDFHKLDLAAPIEVDQLLNSVDYVYHLADVVAGVGYVFRNEGTIFRQNLLINSNVISAVRNKPLKGFVYVGTACSFPAELQTGINARPLKEEDLYPAAPESAYGWSKLMGIYESFLMEKETGTPVSVLMLHNVYGPPCDFSLERSQVIPSLIRKAIRYPAEPFIVWGNGKQGRAFVHVDDVVDALISTMSLGCGKGVIQIGPDICTSIREVAETIVEISGKKIDIQYDRSKPQGDEGRCADYSKAAHLLDWRPKVNLRDGLATLYDWMAHRL